MAHFYGGVQGNRGEATRIGDRKSGLSVFANGYNIGASIDLVYDWETGEDMVFLRVTGGSSGTQLTKIIGKYKASDLK